MCRPMKERHRFITALFYLITFSVWPSSAHNVSQISLKWFPCCPFLILYYCTSLGIEQQTLKRSILFEKMRCTKRTSLVDSEVFFAQKQRIFHFHQERKTNEQVEYKLLCCSHFTETEDFLHSENAAGEKQRMRLVCSNRPDAHRLPLSHANRPTSATVFFTVFNVGQ